MATVKYELLGNAENTPIYLRLSIKRGLTPRRKTGLYINPKNWSKETGLPKQTISDNKNLTIDLLELKIKILKCYNDASTNGLDVDANWLSYNIDLHFKRINKNEQSEFIIDAIQSIIDNAGNRKNAKGSLGISKSRINSYTSLKNILSKYQKEKKYKVKDVNVKFAKDLLLYLINKENYKQSYALKKIADLKTVCYDAELDGLEVSPQLKKISSTRPTNENILYLNPKELEAIQDAKLTTEALKNARKWLLLGCDIGQRGGDLLNLSEDDFVTRNGYEVIELQQQKTGKNITIPVLETTKVILETGLPYRISIQKFNKHIKTVCEKAKIDKLIKGSLYDDKKKRKIDGQYPKHKLISSHVCRRSFATNLYGILPTTLIMQITAHSTEKMLLNYIGKNALDYAQHIADFYTLQALKENKESNLKIVKDASNQN